MQGTRDLWGQWNLGTGRLGEPERYGEGERLMKVELGVKKIVKDSGLVGKRQDDFLREVGIGNLGCCSGNFGCPTLLVARKARAGGIGEIRERGKVKLGGFARLIVWEWVDDGRMGSVTVKRWEEGEAGGKGKMESWGIGMEGRKRRFTGRRMLRGSWEMDRKWRGCATGRGRSRRRVERRDG